MTIFNWFAIYVQTIHTVAAEQYFNVASIRWDDNDKTQQCGAVSRIKMTLGKKQSGTFYFSCSMCRY